MAIGPILLLLLLILAAFAVVVTVIAFIGRQPRVKVASCGKCRYAVEGLTVMTCPECGSDLREVGILTPRGRKPFGPAIWISLWTLVLPVPAMIITALVNESLPKQWTNRVDLMLQTTSPGFTEAHVVLLGNGVSSPDTFERATIKLKRQNVSIGSPIEVNLDRNAKSTNDDGWIRGDDVTAAKLVSWMAATTEMPASEFEDDGDELLTAIADTMQGRGITAAGAFNGVSIRSARSMREPKWFVPVALVFWIAVWIGGIVLIVRRFKRRSATRIVTQAA
ncbi:MAG: hypothetical protein HC795_13285 [Coleofasciculaceae cyanobacterium RL_1_1]|nr:hypothetical protein [Coleofasciculaceae cyanobacterium RL_1_1]